MKNKLQSHLEESFLVQERMLLDNSLFANFTQLVALVEATIADNKKIYLMGSYPDTSRLASLIPNNTVSLNSNSEFITDLICKFGVEEIYSKQVDDLVQDGDIIIGFLSNDFPSQLVEGFAANTTKAPNVLFCGQNHSDGMLQKFTDLVFSIPSKSEGRIREGHQLIYNALVDALNGKS